MITSMVEREFFCSPSRPNCLWAPPSPLSESYRGLFPWGLSGRDVKLTTNIHPVPSVKMHYSIPPLSHTSSRRVD